MKVKALRADRVEVWRVSLDDDAGELAARRAVLSPDELARADRQRLPEHRDLYVLTRGRLRLLLGAHLDVDPARVALEPGELGKPGLGAAFAESGVHFNVAHSGRLACIALTMAGPVGVDVEVRRPGVPVASLADRFFSASEVAALRRLPPEQREAAFFATWARKEAYAKALGTGLSEGFARFAVSVLPGEPVGLRWVVDRPGEDVHWTLRDLPVDEGYAGAVAVRRPDLSVGFWP